MEFNLFINIISTISIKLDAIVNEKKYYKWEYYKIISRKLKKYNQTMRRKKQITPKNLH